jgi:PAS domain S-box-containing protein
MNPPSVGVRDRDESPAPGLSLSGNNPSTFQLLFERSSDAIWLFDPQAGVFIDCNSAAVELMRAGTKEKLLGARPEELSPPLQTDGTSSREKTAQVIALAEERGCHRFEWVIRRFDGQEVPLEVSLTSICANGRRLHVAFSRDISERKKGERELLELNQSLERRVAERTDALATSEALFRAAFQGSPILSVIARLSDQKYVLVNDAFVSWSGWAREELLGRTSSEFGIWESQDERDAAWADLRREGSIHDREIRFRNRRGDSTTVLISFEIIQINHVPHVLAMGIDITARKRAEEASREANRELQKEIEQRKRAEESLNERVRMSSLIADIAVALNAAGELRTMLQQCAEFVVRYLDVAFARVWTLNEATQTLELGASAGCYTHLDGPHSRVRVGQYKIGLIAREKRPLLTNSVQSDPRVSDQAWAAREGMVAFAGYPLLLENRVLGVLAMFSRHPLREDVLRILGSVADSLALGIERKRGQNALAESEARFSAAFRASPAFLGVVRLSDGKYILANQAYLNWMGYPQNDVLGHSCLELGLWPNPADRDSLLNDILALGSIRERECRWRNRSGELFTILLSAETIMLNDIPHMLFMALDITRRKQAEEEMQKALGREKELSQLKSNFVSMVSHEFRTPLGIIQSSAELLRDYHEKMRASERQEQLDSISRNTRRMAGMMEEILVLSRLDAGKLEFQPAALDLNSFCRRLVDEIRSATNRRCSIELSLNSIPSEAQADERLLGHIFTNLLSNAVKYSEPGATVHFHAERNESDAVFVIRDNGIGIPEEDQHLLFQAFHRGSNVGTRPGTGLGLLLVKRCADLHGGKVQVVSKFGEGTTVTVRFSAF